MTRMLPILLIILGGGLLLNGIVLLIKSKPEKNESLNQVIAAVKAHGILTPKEEKLVREVVKAEGKDGDLIVALNKQELEASEEDSDRG